MSKASDVAIVKSHNLYEGHVRDRQAYEKGFDDCTRWLLEQAEAAALGGANEAQWVPLEALNALVEEGK